MFWPVWPVGQSQNWYVHEKSTVFLRFGLLDCPLGQPKRQSFKNSCGFVFWPVGLSTLEIPKSICSRIINRGFLFWTVGLTTWKKQNLYVHEKSTVVLCFDLLGCPLGKFQILYTREKFPVVLWFGLFGLLVSPKIDMFTKNSPCFCGLVCWTVLLGSPKKQTFKNSCGFVFWPVGLSTWENPKLICSRKIPCGFVFWPVWPVGQPQNWYVHEKSTVVLRFGLLDCPLGQPEETVLQK